MSNTVETDTPTVTCAECANMRDEITAINSKLDQMIEVVSAIKDEVAPVIQQISSGPVGTMLGIRKGK